MNNFNKPYYQYNNQNYDDYGPPGPGPMRGRGKFGWNNQNNRSGRYNDAFPNYMGGYGPMDQGPYDDYDNYGPPPYPNMGQGYGPNGPPPPTIKYLLRCGVSKDIVFSMPRELLDMIMPHYCGICSMNLESFSFSRMHYASKNHAKKLKNLMAQDNTTSGYSNPKQIPFKSRDLYCELCDVQITSKVHADSHYAGRSHRAIVDERKPPKNPNLLQMGFEQRIMQLIRRERKQLKPIELTEEDIVETEVKPTAPELYCEICGTSVTCSDQMTMHLNGKRHLAKEKQHIFKQMKKDMGEDGGVKNEDYNEEGQEDENGEEGEENKAQGEEDVKKEEHGDGDNWGQDTGESWDPQDM